MKITLNASQVEAFKRDLEQGRVPDSPWAKALSEQIRLRPPKRRGRPPLPPMGTTAGDFARAMKSPLNEKGVPRSSKKPAAHVMRFLSQLLAQGSPRAEALKATAREFGRTTKGIEALVRRSGGPEALNLAKAVDLTTAKIASLMRDVDHTEFDRIADAEPDLPLAKAIARARKK